MVDEEIESQFVDVAEEGFEHESSKQFFKDVILHVEDDN